MNVWKPSIGLAEGTASLRTVLWGGLFLPSQTCKIALTSTCHQI